MRIKIRTKQVKNIFRHQIVSLYDEKISYFRQIGTFIKLRGNMDWCFYPSCECYSLEYLNEIMKVCKEIEVKDEL